MPDLESAALYPGTCLFEGTNLSVGRGTDRAFQQVGAAWLDAGAVVAQLASNPLPGVRFEAVEFTPLRPGDGKYDGERLGGVRFVVTDRAVHDPTRSAVRVLEVIRSIHGDDFEFRPAAFDRLAGTDLLRLAIEAGQTADSIVDGWAPALAAFAGTRAPYLIYR